MENCMQLVKDILLTKKDRPLSGL